MEIPLNQKSNGMYLFHSGDFDKIAELVLREQAPYMLEKAQPLEIETLADESYSLTIIDRCLSAHGSVLGMINFDDINVEVMSLEKKMIQERLMAGTIVVDASLMPEENHHRRRFTIAHEVSHWIIHRQMYYADGNKFNLRQSRPYIACRKANTSRDNRREFWSESDWLEWQADRFASSMLMPACVFYPVALAVMHRHHAGSYIIEGCGSKETAGVITELTEIFDVSRTAVRIRLKQADMLRSLDVIVCD